MFWLPHRLKSRHGKTGAAKASGGGPSRRHEFGKGYAMESDCTSRCLGKPGPDAHLTAFHSVDMDGILARFFGSTEVRTTYAARVGPIPLLLGRVDTRELVAGVAP
jgi:hypothetical protein